MRWRVRVSSRTTVPVVVPGGEHPTVGTERQRQQWIPVSLHHADRSRPAHQRRKQVATRGDGVIELAPRLCEQEAPVQPVVDEGLGAEALRVRGPSGVARTVALAQRQHSRDHGGDEQHACTGEQYAQPPVGAELGAAFAL